MVNNKDGEAFMMLVIFIFLVSIILLSTNISAKLEFSEIVGDAVIPEAVKEALQE